MSELLPCPFCASDDVHIDGVKGTLWWIWCDGCAAHSGDFGAEQYAIDAWNTRAAPPTAQAESVRETYRLLTRKDVIEKDDEHINDDCITWSSIPKWIVGKEYDYCAFQPMRRKITAAPIDQAIAAAEGDKP